MRSFVLSLTLVFVYLFFAAACSLNTEDDDPTPRITATVAELIAGTDELSDFRRGLNRSGLDSLLAGAANFTLLAPTNAAFDASGIDVETVDSLTLTRLLRYHLIPSLYYGRLNQRTGVSFARTANTQSPEGGNVVVQIAKGEATDDLVFNRTAAVDGPELPAVNGIVQPIGRVLTPPTLLDLLTFNEGFGDFLDLVEAAAPLADGSALSDSLAGTGPLMAFVPQNSPTIAGLNPNATDARDIVLYHLVGNRNLLLENFPDRLTTLQGGAVNVGNRTFFTTSDQAIDLVLEDIQATNGMLHVVGDLFLPE